MIPTPSAVPGAGTASASYSHNIVGFQPCVWRGVDEYIGKGVLVMIVHLVCKAHSLSVTMAPPSTALRGPRSRSPVPSSCLHSAGLSHGKSRALVPTCLCSLRSCEPTADDTAPERGARTESHSHQSTPVHACFLQICVGRYRCPHAHIPAPIPEYTCA